MDIPKTLLTPGLECLCRQYDIRVCQCASDRETKLNDPAYQRIAKKCRDRLFIGRVKGGKHKTTCIYRADGGTLPPACLICKSDEDAS